MKIEYVLTMEEHAEALRVHNPLQQWFVPVIVMAVTVVPLVTELFGSGGDASAAAATQPAAGGAASTTSLHDLCVPFIPWLLIFGLIWFLVFRMLRNVKRPWDRWAGRVAQVRRSSWQKALLVSIAIAAIATTFFLRLRDARAAALTDPSAQPLLNTLLALLPWLVILIFLGVALRRVPVLQRRSWEMQKHLHRPMTVDYSDESIVFAEPLSVHEYRWEFFQGAVESTNLFILYVSALAFHPIPKRAFPDEAQLAEFRDLMRRRVGSGSTGFPVIVGPAPATWAPLDTQRLHASAAPLTPPPLPANPGAPVEPRPGIEDQPPAPIIPPSP